MGLKKCPICGEEYADTYKHCPFCEEDAGHARQPKRYEGGRRLARRNRGEAEEDYVHRRRSGDGEDDGYDDYDDYYDDDDRGSPWFKIVMIILIAIIIACLLYLGRGVIASLINQNPIEVSPSSSMTSDEPQSTDEDVIDPNTETEPTGDENDDNSDDPNGSNTTEPDENNTDTNGDDGTNTNGDSNGTATGGAITLSHEDVSLSGDESFTLSVQGGSGDVSFTSADPSIASVSASGVVTGLKKGTTEITVQRGSQSAVCIVRVKSDGKNASSSEGGSGTTTAASLNKEDFTIQVGESYTLKATGVTSTITWSVADSSVATVDGSGKVTGVKAGTTTVTASWDGQKASCIVRVKN